MTRRQAAKVFAVEVKQIEGDEGQALRMPFQRLAELPDVGLAILVGGDHLAIKDRRLGWQLRGLVRYVLISLRPVVTAPRVDGRLAAIDDDLAAVSIVFDFVNPSVALWRSLNQRRQLRLDEEQPLTQTRPEN